MIQRTPPPKSTQGTKKPARISYACNHEETPKRPDIRSRLGPRRPSNIKDRLGLPNIRSRLGQKNATTPRRANSWEKWVRSSPWEPWVPGMEPKCDAIWNREIRIHMSNFLRAQEASTAPQEDDIQEEDEDPKSNPSADDGENG